MCRWTTSWVASTGSCPVRVAVNLSPAQFKHRSLVSAVVDAVTTAGLDAGRLELEISPTSFRLDEHRRFLARHQRAIDRFRERQQTAFAAERRAWAEAGELEP